MAGAAPPSPLPPPGASSLSRPGIALGPPPPALGPIPARAQDGGTSAFPPSAIEVVPEARRLAESGLKHYEAGRYACPAQRARGLIDRAVAAANDDAFAAARDESPCQFVCVTRAIGRGDVDGLTRSLRQLTNA